MLFFDFFHILNDFFIVHIAFKSFSYFNCHKNALFVVDFSKNK